MEMRLSAILKASPKH